MILYQKNKKEIEKNQEKGQGLAAAGLVCSIIRPIIQILATIGILAYINIDISRFL